MESVKITIRNYRNIPYNNPITLEIKEGITFILGVNNIGKSNLLRMFYELRDMVNTTNTNKFLGTNTPTYEKVRNQKSEGNIEIDIATNGAPYVLHLFRVMNRCQSETEKICALLHDLVEDTERTFEDLEREGFSAKSTNIYPY
jgi:predicted ATP-dependent endonuclease of OLD family